MHIYYNNKSIKNLHFAFYFQIYDNSASLFSTIYCLWFNHTSHNSQVSKTNTPHLFSRCLIFSCARTKKINQFFFIIKKKISKKIVKKRSHTQAAAVVLLLKRKKKFIKFVKPSKNLQVFEIFRWKNICDYCVCAKSLQPFPLYRFLCAISKTKLLYFQPIQKIHPHFINCLPPKIKFKN